MVKLVALYTTPPDTEEFDRHFHTIHAPLIRQYPGLRKLEITHVHGAPLGEKPIYLLAEMYFDSPDAVDQAQASPQGKAVAKDLMSFAAPFVSVFLGDVSE
jgi:uncharacterized protein (TIGR02118 family)